MHTYHDPQTNADVHFGCHPRIVALHVVHDLTADLVSVRALYLGLRVIRDDD